MKFFYNKLLTFLGNQVRKALKVDTTTMEQLRRKYSHICVEVDFKKELYFSFPFMVKIIVFNMKVYIQSILGVANIGI